MGQQAAPGPGRIEDEERLAFVRRSALKWLWRTEVTEAAFAAHRGPKHLLRYEELRAEPVRRLREVLEWLGVTVSDSELERHVERHAFERIPVEQRGEDQFARAASPGLWRENLTAEEQAEIERLIGPKLRELGYGCPSATVR